MTTTTGALLSDALTARARVATAQGEPDRAERDAQDALAGAAEAEAYLVVPDVLECLGTLASEARSHREAARLFGAADGHQAAHRPSAVQGLRRQRRSVDGRAARCSGRQATSTPRGPRAQACPPRRRSPTPGAAAGNANGPGAAGARCTSDRARRRSAGQRRARQQRHRRKAFRVAAHGANALDARLHQARRSPRACSSRKKRAATTETSVHGRRRTTRLC